MYKIDKNTIYLVRGDTLEAQINIKQGQDDYTPQQGDVIRFALKKDELNHNKTQYLNKEPLVLKVIPNDTLTLRLNPNDTAKLDFGTYAYDIQITMADGKVDTFISDKLFLKPEVH